MTSAQKDFQSIQKLQDEEIFEQSEFTKAVTQSAIDWFKRFYPEELTLIKLLDDGEK